MPNVYSDALRFLRFNVQHYALALWGLRLRLDPDYPLLTGFFPSLISEPVLEYRTYGPLAGFALFLAAVLPPEILTALILAWACLSWDRAKFFRSDLAFWRQVYKENGLSHTRGHGRLIETLSREIERRMKAGEAWEELAQEGLTIQDDVLAYHQGRERAPRVNVARPR